MADLATQLQQALDSNTGNGNKPVSFVEEHVRKMDEMKKDPTIDITGAPPNLGRFALPHVQTFQGLFGSYSRAYRTSDEALKHSRDNARFMRNDVGVMECIESRQRSVALLDWQIIPEDETSQDQKELCSQIEKIVRKIRRFTEYRYNLLHAVWYGRYAIQHSWNWTRVGDKMRIMPYSGYLRDNYGWIPINGDKLVFRYDDGHVYQPSSGSISKPDQLGILVGAQHTTGDTINKRWTVEPTGRGLAYFLSDWERGTIALHKHMIEDGPWEDGIDAGVIHGVGVRSRIYWDWFQKQEMLAFLMSYLERSAGGIEIWTYPSGDPNALTDIKKAAKERLADGRNIIFFPKPMGDDANMYDVQVVEPGLAGIDMMQNLLNDYFGHRMKRYILGQTLSSEADATGLGSGLAELHLDTLLQIIKYDATNLEETITVELIDKIKNWNFPHAKNIDVRFVINTEAPEVEKKLQGWQMAWEMGAKLKERDVMELIGAGIPSEDDKVLEQQDPVAGMMPGMGGQPGQPGQGFMNGNETQSRFSFDPNPEKMTDDVMRELFGDPDLKDKQAVTYVSEGGKWIEREVPDASFDTGDRHRASNYGKRHDESKHPRAKKGTAQGGEFVKKEQPKSTLGRDIPKEIKDDHLGITITPENLSEIAAQGLMGKQKARRIARKFWKLYDEQYMQRLESALQEGSKVNLEKKRGEVEKETAKERLITNQLVAAGEELENRGAILEYTSESGSQYWKLPSGETLRLSDHALPPSDMRDRRFYDPWDYNIIFRGRGSIETAVSEIVDSFNTEDGDDI